MKLNNRTKSYVYKAYAFLVWLVPMGVLFGVNHDAYIPKQNGIFGFWAYVMCIFAIFAFKGYLLEAFKKKTLLTFSLTTFAVCLVVRNIADELLLIAGVSSLGSCLSSFVIEPVEQVYENLAYKMIDGEKRLNTSLAMSDKEAWKTAFSFTATEIEEDLKNN